MERRGVGGDVIPPHRPAHTQGRIARRCRDPRDPRAAGRRAERLLHPLPRRHRARAHATPAGGAHRRADGRARAHRRARAVPPAAGRRRLAQRRLQATEDFERRRITVLFADMVGFTDLAESLEPEELAEVLNGVPPRDDGSGDRLWRFGRQPDRRRGHGRLRRPEGDARSRTGLGRRAGGDGDATSLSRPCGLVPGAWHPGRPEDQGRYQHRALHRRSLRQ